MIPHRRAPNRNTAPLEVIQRIAIPLLLSIILVVLPVPIRPFVEVHGRLAVETGMDAEEAIGGELVAVEVVDDGTGVEHGVAVVRAGLDVDKVIVVVVASLVMARCYF